MSTASIRGSLPATKTILGVLDQQAQHAAREARDVIKHELSQAAPRSDRGGQHIADQVTATAARTKTGYRVTASFGRNKPHRGVTAAQVARWVTRGTGLYRTGPGPKRKIRANNPLRRMNLGNGQSRWSVRGQRPNQFVQRARETAHERALEALQGGARKAAEILRRRS